MLSGEFELEFFRDEELALPDVTIEGGEYENCGSVIVGLRPLIWGLRMGWFRRDCADGGCPGGGRVSDGESSSLVLSS